MVVALSGSIDDQIGLSWYKVDDVKTINFQSVGISLPENSSTFFKGFKGTVNGCDKLDTSNVTNMYGMFWWTEAANPNVSNWDTSNVTNMMYMFHWAMIADPDVSNWNTSKVINMARMFRDASNADPDVSNWNTSKVINMAEMFFGAHKARPNVYNWDTSKVTNMQFMFCNAGNAEPNVSNWNISNVINMERMFTNTRVVSLDLSKWRLNKELLNNSKNAANMFNSCNQLKRLKTPTGLRTIIRVAKGDFKIVKLKKYNQVMIEKESQSLNDEYEINKDGDSEAIYHIYNKNVYAGVTFDKNGGEEEAWFNHEIARRGLPFYYTGRLPSENPKKKGYCLGGWAYAQVAAEPEFLPSTKVWGDMTVYAVYKLDTPKLIMKVKAKKINRGRKKVRVLSFRFRPAKATSGYVSDVIIKGKVKKIKLKKGRKKLRGFIVGKITLPLKGEVFFRLRGFKKVKGKRHYGIMLYKNIYWFGTRKLH